MAAPASGSGPGAAHPSFRVARPDVRLSDLEPLALLGEGAFGLVRLVRHRLTGEVFALKQMQKARVVATNQQKNVMSEKRIMSRIRHPFVSA
jgi:serine/threonine protein kinase